MALSKAQGKSRTSNEEKCSLAQECVGSLTDSEHLSCALTASPCLYFCTCCNWQILIVSCPQEECENYSVLLKKMSKIAPAELPVILLRRCNRAEKLAGLFYWQLE